MRAIDDMIDRPLRNSMRTIGSLLLAFLFGCAGAMPGGEQESGPQADVVCRVDGRAIARSDVEVEMRKRLPAASFHGSVDETKQNAMRRDALQSLIDEELEYQDARRRGLSVDPNEIAREYTRLTGRYGGAEAFEKRLERSSIKRKEVMAALEREFLIAQVNERVANDEREISETEKRRYFAENANLFQMPRRAQVRQILIYMPPLERDPDDWSRAFDQANALRSRVEAGESFEKLAAEISHAPESERAKGGLIGIVHPGQLEEPIDSALWSLQAREISEPIRGFKGVYLLSVDHFIEAGPLAYEEIETSLERLLRKNRRQQALENWRASLRQNAEIEIIDPSMSPMSPMSPMVDETSKTL
jgi:parvulin-like peptidyl-prolyl isomerase